MLRIAVEREREVWNSGNQGKCVIKFFIKKTACSLISLAETYEAPTRMILWIDLTPGPHPYDSVDRLNPGPPPV